MKKMLLSSRSPVWNRPIGNFLIWEFIHLIIARMGIKPAIDLRLQRRSTKTNCKRQQSSQVIYSNKKPKSSLQDHRYMTFADWQIINYHAYPYRPHGQGYPIFCLRSINPDPISIYRLHGND
uniref:Uncharacterized protein n=1 Tax=Romanomermis culicivorax TaxID=13658 RepID=A0A915KQQ1_ROMCU